MITVKYDFYDIFEHYQMITAETVCIDSRTIKAAFKAIKKYNAVLFIDTADNKGVRYELASNDNGETILKKTILTFCGTAQNEDTPTYIEYKTALKQELKNALKEVTEK